MSDVAQALLAVGEQLGGYRVEGFLASGGVAEVYRARDPVSQEAVALKVIPPHLARDPQFRERFLQETSAAAALRHRNVIPVYRSGEDRDALFLAMRYIDPNGYDRADLRAVLDKEGPLPFPTALWILEQIADALDLAHRHGLVHRDVTPYNLLIERGDGRLEDSRAYLTDFGIARPMASRSRSSTRTTGTAGFVGTLFYVAPEQIRNEPADPRTDVYALGCVAFEMLTTQPPYGDREHEAAVIFSILEDPVPMLTEHRPRSFGAEFPPAAEAVLERALAKNPSDRYPTAGELVVDLRHALLPGTEGQGVPPPTPVTAGPAPAPAPVPAPSPSPSPAPRRVRRWAVAGSSTVAVLVVAGLVAWALGHRDPRYPGTRPEAPVAFTRPLGWHEHDQPGSFVLFSPLDLCGLFSGQPAAWPKVVQEMTTDRSQVVGVAVRATDSGAASDDPVALQAELGRDLAGSRVSWDGDVPTSNVAGWPARTLTGRIRPPSSTDTLWIRVVVVQLGQQSRTAHLIFFAPGPPPDPSVFDQQQDTFRRVLNSLDVTPPTPT